ncbi:hypothetical protein VPNG_06150 [Cytospora leucostoma]|uniref:Mid2 domain-containing protein n=1 Tax=Cytospora leucostoma TaxID=1230097 RepID=A0A423WYM6_9PEZI|nr:hypothetical protein VPNG_06150 [Cytospora leucostoma]
MLGMGRSRCLDHAATFIERPFRTTSKTLSRSRLCLVAILILISPPSAAASDSGAAFDYPIGGESFYDLDYVNVTYQSTFTSPLLYTYCSINGVTRQMQVQDAEPDNGSALIHLNITTNVPCWFELSPGQVGGVAVDSAKWTVLARSAEQSTWSATAAATSTPTSTVVAMASTTSAEVTDQTSPTERKSGLGSGAKIGIAMALSLGIFAIFAIGFWMWWRRRQKREVAKDMVNFVDGDIVNLMDRGRFEKRTKPPEAYYDPYLGVSSQSTITPSTYAPASAGHPTPPAEQQSYYAPVPLQHSTAPPVQSEAIPPPPVVTNDNAAWPGHARHPWSPPDYEGHTQATDWSIQNEGDFHAEPREAYSISRRLSAVHPVEALPAILPEMKPQAELPAREQYGHGYEQELPAPQQVPLSRHIQPNGLEFEEQKFLLADILPLRERNLRPGGPGPAG